MNNITQALAQELNQPLQYVTNVVNLLDEGNTIPFIARYRKELHGAMDDTTLRNLETRLTYLRNLQARREEVISAIESQGKLTGDLRKAIEEADHQEDQAAGAGDSAHSIVIDEIPDTPSVKGII